MKEEIQKLEKLPPEERIKRLKEIAEINEREINEVKRLIKESESEIEEKQSIQKKLPLPQLRSIDISTLFGKGTQEDIILSTHSYKISPQPTDSQQDSNLEGKISPSEINSEQASEFREIGLYDIKGDYRLSLVRYSPANTILERTYNIMSTIKYDPSLSINDKTEMIKELALISYGTTKKLTDFHDGSYLISEDSARRLVSTHNIIKSFLDQYKG